MSTKKIKTVQEVKELLNKYIEPIQIGHGSNSIKVTPQEATWNAQNIIKTCQMALIGLDFAYSGMKISELPNNTYMNLQDVVGSLNVANSLLPIIEMEFLDKLQEKL